MGKATSVPPVYMANRVRVYPYASPLKGQCQMGRRMFVFDWSKRLTLSETSLVSVPSGL